MSNGVNELFLGSMRVMECFKKNIQKNLLLRNMLKRFLILQMATIYYVMLEKLLKRKALLIYKMKYLHKMELFMVQRKKRVNMSKGKTVN